MSSLQATIRVMGIVNCDTVKRARDWLSTQALPYEFQDFKKFPPSSDQIDLWLSQIPWDTLVNRKGTLWRRLSADEQAGITNAQEAKALALRLPNIMKRPIVQWQDGRITVGFSPEVWQERMALQVVTSQTQ